MYKKTKKLLTNHYVLCYNKSNICERTELRMNKLVKKTIMFIAAATAAVSVHITGFAAGFTDMPSDPVMKTALENAVSNGLLNGYETGEIKPDGKITRAEMSAIITRCFGATKTADISGFKDVPADAWYYDSLSKGVAMEAFKGDGANLNPENNITFQETFTVISRIFDLQDMDESSINGLADKDKIDDWAKEFVVKVFTGGYWGQGITELRPNDYITRGEFAILMDRLVQLYVNEPGEYDSLEDVNVVIRTGGVTFNEVTNTKRIIVGDGADGDVVFTKSDLNAVVGRAGNIVPAETVVTSLRLTVVGAQASIGSTIERVKGKTYNGIKGTVFNLGTISF